MKELKKKVDHKETIRKSINMLLKRTGKPDQHLLSKIISKLQLTEFQQDASITNVILEAGHLKGVANLSETEC